MDASALNATGIAFAALGATMLFAAVTQRSQAPSAASSSTGEAGGGGIRRSRMTEGAGRAAAGSRDAPSIPGILARRSTQTTTNGHAATSQTSPIALLGYFALMDGFLLQFIATLATRTGGMTG